MNFHNLKTQSLAVSLLFLTLLFSCVSQKKSRTTETGDADGINDPTLASEPNYQIIPEVQEAAPSLYEMEDASMMKQQVHMKRSMNASTVAGNVERDIQRMPIPPGDPRPVPHNTEEYKRIYENDFVSPKVEPLSTFSIDVDVASYANMRRFLNQSQMPYPDAVRIEEMVNYFSYDYEAPKGEDPFSIYTELSECPWNTQHQLLHIGLQGEEIETEDLPSSNLVFLFDVSGSMDSPAKLPLLKSAFRLLVNELQPEDRVAIVVYAGAAGMVLPSTAASEKSQILEAIEKLNAGGSTAGGEGIELAYELAKEHFIKEGNNRVILATDGDFNVGPSSEGALVRMIEEKRKEGIFLSVLGFGTGNYKDSKMEMLADKGNGNYAYIDNILEAKKVLVTEMGGTLYTIAKDVKLQLEFNPQFVKGYRLIGYENRRLAAQDFNDDTKDAGELGSGHTVTALYEIVPPEAKTEIASVDELKYQQAAEASKSNAGGELLTVKFRYKQPDGDTSKLIEHPVPNKERERAFDRFSCSGPEDYGRLSIFSLSCFLRDAPTRLEIQRRCDL